MALIEAPFVQRKIPAANPDAMGSEHITVTNARKLTLTAKAIRALLKGGDYTVGDAFVCKVLIDVEEKKLVVSSAAGPYTLQTTHKGGFIEGLDLSSVFDPKETANKFRMRAVVSTIGDDILLTCDAAAAVLVKKKPWPARLKQEVVV